MTDYLRAKYDLTFYEKLNISEKQLPNSTDFIEDRYIKILQWTDLLPLLETTTYPDADQQNISIARDLEIEQITMPIPASHGPEPAKVINIFISYVKYDEKYMKELLEHLEAMRNQYLRRKRYKITLWGSDQIIPGQDWKKNIEQQLVQAHIILLLVSIKFINSQLCRTIQIQPALRRHETGEAWVIPVIVRPCTWTDEEFGHLHPLPTDRRAIIKWKPRDDAYVDIINGIRRAIDNLP